MLAYKFLGITLACFTLLLLFLSVTWYLTSGKHDFNQNTQLSPFRNILISKQIKAAENFFKYDMSIKLFKIIFFVSSLNPNNSNWIRIQILCNI